MADGQTMVYGLWSMDYRLWTMVYGLWPSRNNKIADWV